MPEAIIGLDVGTTTGNVVLFDPSGSGSSGHTPFGAEQHVVEQP